MLTGDPDIDLMLDDTIPRATRRELLAVAMERRYQDKAWPGQQDNPDTPWVAILVEEVGEVAKASLANPDDGDQDLLAELIQVAAVAVAWAEVVRRQRTGA